MDPKNTVKLAELRRKKILANAEERLRKITGRPSEKVSPSRVPVEGGINLNSANGCNPLCNGSATEREDTPLEFLDVSVEANLNSHDDFFSRDLLDNDFVSQRHEEASESRIQERKIFKYECYLFLTLGIIVRLLFYLHFSWLFLNNILAPFIVVCIPRVSAIFARDIQLPGVLQLMFLTVVNQRKFILPLKTFCALRTILQFFALYIFSFTISDFIVSERNS